MSWHMSLQPWALCMTFCMVCIIYMLSLHRVRLDSDSLSWMRSNLLNYLQFTGRKGVQGAQPGPVLDWIQRVRIAVDAARGLEYLHEKVQPSVIHRDIRSSNVLLFEDFKAKVADFNLSNQAPDMAARLHSTRVLGTFGYHAPE